MNHQYRKKPVVIEAFQMPENAIALREDWPQWLVDAWETDIDAVGALKMSSGDSVNGTPSGYVVETKEGTARVAENAWIIRGIEGELYPCDDQIFRATYEKV